MADQPLVTQKTIADELGLSQTAVSFILRNKGGRYSSETREQVLQKARALGYQCDRKTSGTVSTNRLLLCVNTADLSSPDMFHYRLLAGMQRKAQEEGYLLAQHVLRPGEKFATPVHSAAAFILNFNATIEQVVRLNQKCPVILLNRQIPGTGCENIMPDNVDGVRQPMRHLYELGHRRFAFFSLRGWHIHPAERYGGFHQVLAELGLPLCPHEYIFTPERGAISDRDLEEKTRDMLRMWRNLKGKRPTALLCTGDVFAGSVLRVARELGISIPGDLSVVGYDNVAECEAFTPRLSSVEQPFEAMGYLAIARALGRIAGDNLPLQEHRLPIKWIPRESIGPAPE